MKRSRLPMILHFVWPALLSCLPYLRQQELIQFFISGLRTNNSTTDDATVSIEHEVNNFTLSLPIILCTKWLGGRLLYFIIVAVFKEYRWFSYRTNRITTHQNDELLTAEVTWGQIHTCTPKTEKLWFVIFSIQWLRLNYTRVEFVKRCAHSISKSCTLP